MIIIIIIIIIINTNAKVADFGFSRDVMVNNIYERKSEGRLPIRFLMNIMMILMKIRMMMMMMI